MQPADVAQYNTPLTLWGHLWRTALCLVISGLAWSVMIPDQLEKRPWQFFVDLALGVAAYVVVLYRRRWPFPIAVLLTVVGFFSGAAAGPSVLAAFSLATHRRIWQLVVVGVLGIAGGHIYAAIQPSRTSESWLVDLGFGTAITLALIAWGMYIGSRRELLWSLRERASQAEARQELQVEQARSHERERIAREMHDVLAHRISLVTMHAGALAFRDDLSAAQIKETAELIQGKAHEALTDLRQVLGILRGTDGDRPQPTMSDLRALVAEAVQSGMIVHLDNSIRPDADVPAQTGRTVYRLVQEGLTNARKHAVGAHVSIVIAGAPEQGVRVRLANGKRVGQHNVTPGAGLGLAGLRERTELVGGTLQIDDTVDEFALTGWLPWPK